MPDGDLMELFVLNGDLGHLVLLNDLQVVEVINAISVNKVAVDVLLLLLLVLLFLLENGLLLPLDVKGVPLVQVALEQAHHLQLVSLPLGRVLVLELGEDVLVLEQKHVLSHVVGHCVRGQFD